ncbi:MAG TPA: 4-hydroxy-tetrahydrodipicolinate reductase [Marinilabiliaceae bacterium]|nr:4-hydroxy-tetrahydrodipicolinate reductase [Marinilabiliaceae bacterium]
MKIALIGYGKMGKTIERIAVTRGHKIVARVDPFNGEDFSAPGLATADIAIEFSRPETAFNNYLECFKLNLPVVSGTTGWLDKLGEVKALCEKGQTFFYASNFSIGVNILFAINEQLAKIMNKYPQYEVDITEVHHTHKLDAPSGTAITLAEGIFENLSRKTKWELDKQSSADAIAIKAIREGEVPGIHTVKYESEVDEITIHHSAKSRDGLALGAIIAAEFTQNKKGFLSMKDLLKF